MTNSFPHVDSQQRLERARASLEGLSVGDAFGERFFVSPSIAEDLIEQRALPAPPWPYTDDTAMAISIVEALQHSGAIDQDWLATAFTEAYVRDPSRGYGPAMHSLFRRIHAGESWRELTHRLFSVQGSFGSGAAMRVAPLGAYFANDLDMVVKQAELSASVTPA